MAHIKAAVLAHAILFPQMHEKGNEIKYLKYMYFYCFSDTQSKQVF